MKFDRLLVLLGTLWCAGWLLVWLTVTALGLYTIHLCSDGTCDSTEASNTMMNIIWWALPLFGAGTYFGVKSLVPDFQAFSSRPRKVRA